MKPQSPPRGGTHWRLRTATTFLVTAALTACGGGGGGSAGSTPGATLSGVAVDGYLSNATVFLDINRNGLQDAGEPTTTTDANGRYTLDYTGVTAPINGTPIVVTGGVDTDTGYVFTGRLSAPADLAASAQVVSPLTSLVDALVKQGMDTASARLKVATALGLGGADALLTDPVAVMTNQPAIYTQQVALQRAVQLIASANTAPGESAHDAQERIIKALATAIKTQASAISIGDLVSSISASNTLQGKQLADAIHDAVESALRNRNEAQAKAVLKAMDQLRSRMERNKNDGIHKAADDLDIEYGVGTSAPFRKLADGVSDSATLTNVANLFKTSTTIKQPLNTAGRLMASNCFQCHGTGGVGGFDKIRGSEAAEVKEFLTKPANSNIMAAHAQGYTSAQLDAIIAYLKQ